MNIDEYYMKDGSRGSAACPRKEGRFVWRAPLRHARDGRRRAATWQTTVPGFPAGDRTKVVTGALVDAGATGHAFPWRGFPGREEPGGVAPAAVPCSGDRAGERTGPDPVFS